MVTDLAVSFGNVPCAIASRMIWPPEGGILLSAAKTYHTTNAGIFNSVGYGRKDAPSNREPQSGPPFLLQTPDSLINEINPLYGEILARLTDPLDDTSMRRRNVSQMMLELNDIVTMKIASLEGAAELGEPNARTYVVKGFVWIIPRRR